MDGRTNSRISDHSNEERIASGCSAHRGRLHHVGVRFARRGSLERRRKWRCLRSAVSTRGTSRRCGHVSLSGLGVVRSGRRPARTSWLSRAAARQWCASRRVGHGRCSGVVHRLRHHSFERVDHSGRWARLERRAEVTGMGRGSRWRRHRAAWRLIRNTLAASHQSCRAGLIRTFG